MAPGGREAAEPRKRRVMPNDLSDEHLAGRCRQGDERAWEALVRRHSRLIFALAYRSTGRREDAEDVTQDVFWKVSRMLDRYDGVSAFKPWLLQVARNHFIDHHRSRKKEKSVTVELDAMPVEPGSLAPTQAHDLLRRERAAAVAQALSHLPGKLREAVLLRDVEGLEYDEIAGMTGLPLGTVKSRINRGRLQLAAILKGREADLA